MYINRAMHKAVESILYKTMLKHYYTTTCKICFSDWTKSKGNQGRTNEWSFTLQDVNSETGITSLVIIAFFNDRIIQLTRDFPFR